MRITGFLKCTIAASALILGHGGKPALAAAGDDPASVIATRTATGETTRIVNGPAGFQVVIFFDAGGTEVSRIESGTPNTGVTPPPPTPPGGAYAQAAADQVRSAAENFIPGLNGNADLPAVFGIPFFPGANPLINGGQPPRGNLRGLGPVGPGGADNDDELPVIGVDGQFRPPTAAERCRRRIPQLEQEIAAKKRALSRLRGSDTRGGFGDGTIDSDSFSLINIAKLFLRGARNGRLDASAEDIAAAEAILANERNIKDLSLAQAAVATHQKQLAESIQAQADLNQEIADMRETIKAFQAEGDTEAVADIENTIKIVQGDVDFAAAAEQGNREKIPEAQQELAAVEKRLSDKQIKIDDLRENFRDARARTETRTFGGSEETLIKEISALEFELDRCRKTVEQAAFTSSTASAEPPVAIAAHQSGNGGELSFSISTRDSDTGLDPRLNLFLKGTLTFHDDGRTGVGQDGETYAFSGGVSWLVSPDTNIGLLARYGRSDLSGSSGSTGADTYSLGAFMQNRLSEKLFLDLVAAYTHSDLNSVFIQPGITTTGSPEISSFAAQAKLSGRVETDNFTIIPSFGASYTHVNQHAFFLSDGTLAPSDVSDRLSLLGGATFTKTIRDEVNGQTITPNFGLTLFANLTDTDSFLLPNGSRSGAGTFGATAAAGLSVQTDAGTSFDFSGSVTSFEKGQNSFGLSLSATIPLN